MTRSQALVVFVLCIFLNGDNAQRAPTISYISQTQIKDVGDKVELACSVKYTADYPVLWIKQDSELGKPISLGSTLILHDSRFKIKYNESISTYTLQLKDIKETDVGTYACVILKTISNRVTATVEVQVRRPPFIYDNSTWSVVVPEGEAVKMECYAGGYPPPRISWRRENNNILPTGSSIYRGNKLEIMNTRKEDSGTYYCVAENGVGRESIRMITVVVKHIPVVTVSNPRLKEVLQHDRSDEFMALLMEEDKLHNEKYVKIKGNHPRAPKIAYISQTQIKNVGDKADLACSVQYTADYPVLWIKQDSSRLGQPISLGSALILHDSRFSLTYDELRSTYTLQFKDIQESDAGTYACVILKSPRKRVTATVEVQVRRHLFISDNSTRSVVASEGEAVEMECYAGGYPPPMVSWRRENNDILPNGRAIYRGNKLEIKNIRKEDRGTYYCMAENGVGRMSKRNIAVEVEFAPVVTVLKPRLKQALKYRMHLECHVEAYPPPAILWKKDDIDLYNNQQYEISNFSTSDEFTATILRVTSSEQKVEDTYGEYICEAANKYGISTGRIGFFGKFVE